ncbi:MAG: hypothetical protein K5931_04755 [Lachnospiraceae bacterium]|nr:hypothetical protein [Lachnospiraceae bacterium]
MVRNDKFIKKTFNRALLPVMISTLASTINALIDAAFVSRCMNEDALAVISMSMPVFLLLCMIGCLVGIGAFTAASISLGQGDDGSAVKYYHSALLLSLIFSLIFMITGLFFSDEVAFIISEDPNLLPMLEDYCRITLIGSLTYIMAYVPTYFVQLEGNPGTLTIMMNIMMGTDILFDWLFLYVFKLEIKGAALASVLSMAVTGIYGFIKLHTSGGIFRISLKSLKIFGLLDIITYGSSSALDSLMGTFFIFAINKLAYLVGNTDSVAIWAVLNSLSELSLIISMGIPRTASPLLGICLSGKDNYGVKMLIRHEIKIGTVMMLIYSAFIIFLHGFIADFFKIESSLFLPLSCLGLSLVIGMYVSILRSFYSVSKRFFLSGVISVLRTFVFPIGFASLFVAKGVNIWYFLPAGMLTSLAITILMAVRRSYQSRGKSNELSKILLLDKNSEKNKSRKIFSIVATKDNICDASRDISDFFIEQKINKKTAVRLGLALEEVLVAMVDNSKKKEDNLVDIRLYSQGRSNGLTIMFPGRRYNPFQNAEYRDNGSELDESKLGIHLINSIASDCHFLYTLGMNVLTVEFSL